MESFQHFFSTERAAGSDPVTDPFEGIAAAVNLYVVD